MTCQKAANRAATQQTDTDFAHFCAFQEMKSSLHEYALNRSLLCHMSRALWKVHNPRKATSCPFAVNQIRPRPSRQASPRFAAPPPVTSVTGLPQACIRAPCLDATMHLGASHAGSSGSCPNIVTKPVNAARRQDELTGRRDIARKARPVRREKRGHARRTAVRGSALTRVGSRRVRALCFLLMSRRPVSQLWASAAFTGFGRRV